jgi:pimeloyl-ACP methyl ester carboxylesterase
MRQHVYLSPGMFGFGRLGSYNYFSHVERELAARFAGAGHELVSHPIDDLPTASIRRRATRLAEVISQTSGVEPIHLLGHSTGGLDARLVASPATRSMPAEAMAWLPRLRSITTMNTPHFGTPLASFFTTASGQHVLAGLSVLTVAGLTAGAQPLAAASVLLGFLRAADKLFPFKIQLLDRSIQSMIGLIDDARSPEVRTFLGAIEDDQGSMLQLSPESMDLVVARASSTSRRRRWRRRRGRGAGSRPSVTRGARCRCRCSLRSTTSPRRTIRAIRARPCATPRRGRARSARRCSRASSPRRRR